MATATYTRLVLASYPKDVSAVIEPDVFRTETTSTPKPGDGQVLVQVEHLSVDPVLRAQIRALPLLTVCNQSY